jgi:hypothetical protein
MQCEAASNMVMGPLIIEKAHRFCKALSIDDNKLGLSNGWLDGFKKRHGLQWRKLNGEAGSVNPQSAKDERICL